MKLSESKNSYISTKNKLDKLSGLAAQNQQMKDYLHHIEEINLKLKSYIEKIKSSKPYQLWQSTQQLIKRPVILSRQIQIRSEFAIWNKRKSADKNNVLIFGVINYEFRYQRPQHLAYELSKKGHRVIYIEPDFITPTNKNNATKPYIKKIATNLYKVNLSTLDSNLTKKLFVYYGEISKEDRITLTDSFKTLLKTASIIKAVIKVDNPSWVFIVNKLKLPIIYDCIDDHGAFETRADNIVSSEDRLIRKSNAILFSSHGLAKKINRDKRKNVYVIENAGEYDHFANVSKNSSFPRQLKLPNSPILGYCGAISEWFDVKLLGKIAENFPKSSIILIGTPNNPKVRELAQMHKNIHLLGEIKYDLLPTYYQMFSVCMIPFIINDVTKTLSPVKIYEYFATGIPVVTTNIPEFKQFGNLVYLSKDSDEFCQNIKKALAEKDSSLSLKRKQFAKKNTWEDRATQLESIINRVLKHIQ